MMNIHEAPTQFLDPTEDLIGAERPFSIETLLSIVPLLIDKSIILAERSTGDGLVIVAERSVPIIREEHLERGFIPGVSHKDGIGVLVLTARDKPLKVFIDNRRVVVNRRPDYLAIRIESPRPVQIKLLEWAQRRDLRQVLAQELSRSL